MIELTSEIVEPPRRHVQNPRAKNPTARRRIEQMVAPGRCYTSTEYFMKASRGFCTVIVASLRSF